MAAPAAASRPPADHAPQAESRPLVFGPEGAATGAPLTSEPPLPDAEPLTSEPPLAESAPLTSEWTGERGGEWDTEPAGDGPGRAEA
ncbi:hypothetical protein [Streptomyces sp. NPDC004065]|uniref:hypothetical protein n=1 Tax=Streptomyces sp. NPDC004065 TaxID=3364689 RepID=UPI00384C449C